MNRGIACPSIHLYSFDSSYHKTCYAIVSYDNLSQNPRRALDTDKDTWPIKNDVVLTIPNSLVIIYEIRSILKSPSLQERLEKLSHCQEPFFFSSK